jgi:hypothetical protein
MIEQAFNRALSGMGEKYKILITAGVLCIGSVLTAFFATFSPFADSLMQKTLFLVPLFITLGLLLSLGSLLCKIYLEEVKRNKVHLIPTFKTIWVRLLGASYFSLPFLAAFIVLWLTIGLFELLTLIPYVGSVLSTLFAFIPFVINFCFYLLAVFGLFALFMLAPVMGVVSQLDQSIVHNVLLHWIKNPYRNLVNFFVALAPAFLCGFIGYLALGLCAFCFKEAHPLLLLIQNISLAIPFAALLLFPAIFFFQYAMESYLMIESSTS